MDTYITSAIKQFEYYKRLGDKTFNQLTEQDLVWQYTTDINSIAVIVNHLSGNMKSRWTDFLISDGEKTWRNREEEFQDIIKTIAQLKQKWEDGWQCLFKALNSITAENFNTKIYIRNQSHTIVEAVNRQLAHYAYHIGQIVFIGRMIKGADWESLSIPKGKSDTFNKQKFAKGKHDGHFTDDI